MVVLSVCMCVHHVTTWYLWKPEEGIRTLGIGITDSCEPPYV